MSLYSIFLALTFCSTYLGIFFLRIFHYGFIYENPAAIITQCVPTVSISFFLILACAIAEKPILQKFDRIIAKARKNRESLTEKDIDALKACYKKYDIAIAIGDAVGFLLGAGSTAIIEAIKGLAPFNPVVFVIIELQSVSVGFLCYTINVFTIKKVLMARQFRELNIKGISTSLTNTLKVAIITSIALSIQNMMTVPINLLLNPSGDVFAKFIRYSIIGAIFTAIACYAVYILLIKKIQDTEKEVSSKLFLETKNLAEATKESARSGQDQNAAVKEIVATMQDSAAMATNIGEKVKGVTDLAEKSHDAVLRGNKALQINVQELIDIKNKNMLTIEGIKNLNERIASIWDIVSIINNVADQTKIIAFNAELEASSSGEAGKNFHIVATEIRRLSDNNIDSIKEIRERTTEIQQASDSLILDSEKMTKQIAEGYESAKGLENHFDSIMNASVNTANSSRDILSYVDQLTSSSEQIFITLKQIAEGIESFSQSTKHISESSEKVSEIASLL